MADDIGILDKDGNPQTTRAKEIGGKKYAVSLLADPTTGTEIKPASQTDITGLAGTAGDAPPALPSNATGTFGWLRKVVDTLLAMAALMPALVAGSQPVTARTAGGAAIGSLDSGTGSFGMLMAAGATEFYFSNVNSSTTQLAAAATFPGAIETIVNAQAYSIIATSDQPGTLTVFEYIDVAGARVSAQRTFSISAGVPFSVCRTANGNYFKLTFTNNGASATTTLNVNVAFGTLPAVTALGNAPVALNEVGGTPFSLGPVAPTASVPVVFANHLTVTGNAAQTATNNNILDTTGAGNATVTTGYQSGVLTIVSTGTAGTWIAEQRDGLGAWVPVVMYEINAVSSAPINAAVTATATTRLFAFPNSPTEFRVRIASTITGGSIQAQVTLSQVPFASPIVIPVQSTAGNLLLTASQGGTWTVQPGNTANTTRWIVDSIISTRTSSGPTRAKVKSAATTNATILKASAGQIYTICLFNTTASAKYLKLYSKTTLPVPGTDTPIAVLQIPANGSLIVSCDLALFAEATGLGYAITGAFGELDTTVTAVDDVVGFIAYA